MRDPRVDPKPGDVVIFGPQWQSERYTVISAPVDFVKYRMGIDTGHLHTCPLRDWRDWAATGEVIHRAEGK